MCEVMPLAVTAMMPVFMFPVLGVLDAKTVSKEFLPVGFVSCFVFIVVYCYNLRTQTFSSSAV